MKKNNREYIDTRLTLRKYRDRVGVRFDRLPVELLILLKLISTLGRNLGTISFSIEWIAFEEFQVALEYH